MRPAPFVLALLVVACAPPAETTSLGPAETSGSSTGAGPVSWVNLVAGPASLDVVGTALVATVPFAQGTPPLEAPDGPVTWALPGGEALLTAAPAGPSTVIACGTTTDPAVVVVPALPTGARRIRVVHAAAGVGPIAAFLRQGGPTVPLGAPTFGQRTQAFDVTGPMAELTLVRDGGAVVMTLPPQEPGHAVDAIAALTPEGALFVLLQRDDGLTLQAGAQTHVARWRLANMTGHPLDATLEEATIAGVPPRDQSPLVTLWPGTKSVTLVAETGEAAELPPFPLATGSLVTTFVFPDGPAGPVAPLTLAALDGDVDASMTRLRFVHGAPELGTVTFGHGGNGSGGGAPPGSLPLAPGEVSAPVVRPSGQVDISVTAGGALDRTYAATYLPTDDVTLILGTDAAGLPRLGMQTSADTPIWWRYADEDLSRIRVLNLTSRFLTADIPTWFKQDPQNLFPRSGTSAYQIVAGPATVTATDPKTAETWSWEGEVEAGRHLTLALWEDGGKPRVTLTDDTPTPELGVRLVNVAPGLGPVGATWEAPGGQATPLGVVEPGAGTEVATAGFVNGLGGALRLDTDQDGAADLTFLLSYPAYTTLTNAWLFDDPAWPTILLQSESSEIQLVNPEELHARLRVVYLPTGASQLAVMLDGEPITKVNSKPSFGAGPKAFYGVGEAIALPVGDHELTLSTGSHEASLSVTLEGASRYTLAVTGAGGLVPTLLDDAPGGPTVAVFHGAPGAGPATVEALGPGGTVVVAYALPPGAATDAVSLPWTPTGFTLDRDGDGTPDWLAKQPGDPAFARVFVTGPTESPMLLVVRDTGWPVLLGDALD
ncbi:MAG: hypothetical protein AMXMBFR64_15010 [Myxococcales bacterium]